MKDSCYFITLKINKSLSKLDLLMIECLTDISQRESAYQRAFQLIEDVRSCIKDIKAIPTTERRFANTIGALEDKLFALQKVSYLTAHYQSLLKEASL